MFHASRSLKSSSAAADRAVLLNVAAANGVPTLSGQQMVPRGVWQNIDAIMFTTLTDFTVGFWWWYESAQLWVLDTSIGTSGYTKIDHTDGVVRIPILDNNKSICADGLYVEVKSFGIGAKANVWLQGQQ